MFWNVLFARTRLCIVVDPTLAALRSGCSKAANFSRLNGSMFALTRTMSRFPSRLNLNLLAAALLAASGVPVCAAQGTHLWTQSRLEEFEKGTPQGVCSSPATAICARARPEGNAYHAVDLCLVSCRGQIGTAYLGTGSPATVLRVGKDGKPFTLFETKDLSVQAVQLGPDGALYAATVPSGKVYRLKPNADTKQDEASATVVFDLRPSCRCGRRQACQDGDARR